MFIDYVALMLANMTAGLVLLAGYVGWGLGRQDQKGWAPAFGMVGLVALVSGFRMAFTWPLPGAYGSLFGEMTVLFGALFAGAAVALAKGWSLVPVGVYGVVAGLIAVLLGLRVMDLGMTKNPVLSGTGFILTGLGGASVLSALIRPGCRRSRIAASILLLAAAAVWALTTGLAYWGHMGAGNFTKWLPAGMAGG